MKHLITLLVLFSTLVFVGCAPEEKYDEEPAASNASSQFETAQEGQTQSGGAPTSQGQADTTVSDE